MKYVIFIRHNWHNTEEDHPELNKIMVPLLYNQNLIGIHFQENSLTRSQALNSEYYTGRGKSLMELMPRIAKKGALVFATYKTPEGNKIKLGEVKPQEIELLPVKNREGHFIKALRLSNVKESNSPILLAIQPTQGTLVEWSKNPDLYIQKIKILECLHNGKPLPRYLGSLIPAQQEVLCYEYLKEQNLIKHLLLPIGRTLQDLDIYGVDNSGHEVFAQVTYSEDKNEIESKIKRLKEYKKTDNHVYLFVRSLNRIDSDGIRVVLMNKVFDYFKDQKIIDYMTDLD